MRLKRHYRQMTPERAAKIREQYFVDRRKQIDIAREYGISQGSVSRIISNITWSNQ